MTEREFETMIREHKGTVYTVCYMFSNDPDEVADLFQETLINLWRGSGTFRGDSALSSWIWKVALNTCISFDRKKKRGPQTGPGRVVRGMKKFRFEWLCRSASRWWLPMKGLFCKYRHPLVGLRLVINPTA